MKTLICGIIAAALGALAGALLMHGRLAPEVAVLTGRAESVESENKDLKDKVRRLMKGTEQLEQRLAELTARMDASSAQAPVASHVLEEPAEPVSDEADIAEASAAPESDSRRGVRRRGAADIIGADQDETSQQQESRDDPEGRAARVQEFEQRMRERVTTVLQEEYDNAADADTQERVQTIQAYTDQLAQLRTAMRDAQTDQERDGLRQSMRETYGALQEVVRTQQDSMLRTFASSNGITDTGKQDTFINGLRDLQSNTFFQTDRMMGGGGRGGPWRPESRWDGPGRQR